MRRTVVKRLSIPGVVFLVIGGCSGTRDWSREFSYFPPEAVKACEEPAREQAVADLERYDSPPFGLTKEDIIGGLLFPWGGALLLMGIAIRTTGELLSGFPTLREHWRHQNIYQRSHIEMCMTSKYLYRAVHPLTESLYKDIELGNCPNLSECVVAYVEGIRKHASEINYYITSTDEKTFEAELNIAKDADEGNITLDDAQRRLRLESSGHLDRLLRYKRD